MKTPRDYQRESNDEAIAHMKGAFARKEPSAFLQVLSVSSGKTLMIADLAKNTVEKGGKVICLSHQGELTQQASDEATEYGLTCSVYAASLDQRGHRFNPIFAMRQTLANALDSHPFNEMKVALLIVDEVHTFDFTNPESTAGKIYNHFLKLNPFLQVVGLTGTPYRNNEHLMNQGFFKGRLTNEITLARQIREGWVLDYKFGHFDDGEHDIDFSSLPITENEGTGGNYSEEEMDRILQGEYHKTLAICQEVRAKAQTMKGSCLIFCGSKIHTEQVKYGLLQAGAAEEEIAIVTDSSTDKERADALTGSKTGRIKYFVNVAIATTGWSVLNWEYLVFMRPVASRNFFEQSIGRILRVYLEGDDLALYHSEGTTAEMRKEIIARSRKPFGVVDDYAGVIERLGHLLDDNEEVQEAKLEKAKREGETKRCPICEFENGTYAQRCINRDENGDRCLHYWQYNECRDEQCVEHVHGFIRRTQNAVTAQTCRVCEKMLADPNKALINKAYKEGEYRSVKKMTLDLAKNQKGVIVKFHLVEPDPELGVPMLYFHLDGSEQSKKIWFNNFVKIYVTGSDWQFKMRNMGAPNVVRNAAVFNTPTEITVRKNEKNKFIIGRRKFRSGRECEDLEAS
ncbi:MAG: DEAD/DEAH box helicase family protein [Acidiferrobacterales bacterium]|nr:DEAD/DEAH box helicase family protein [Acidiferrobacterales bacterium]